MSIITEMIETYRAGTTTLDQLVAKLADYHYATPARMQGGPTDIFERGAWLDEQPYYTEGSWDEVLRARDYGSLSPEEYDAINRGFEAGRKDAKGGSGSGNFGHEGRPGEIGGSGAGGSGHISHTHANPMDGKYTNTGPGGTTVAARVKKELADFEDLVQRKMAEIRARG